MEIKTRLPFVLFCFIFLYNITSAQDLIVKTNNDTIRAKIIEVGTNAVSFKKLNYPDGPTFVENRSDIRMIKYSNGDVQQFSNTNINTITTQTNSIQSYSSATTNSATAITNSASTSYTNTMKQEMDNGKVKIEMVDKKYTINGQKASRKDVDNQLSKSKNPAVILPLKAAKLTKTAQKIVKITSIPSTIGGGFSTLLTGVNLYNDIRRDRTTSKSYVNAAISLLTTLSLPITNKILKKKSDKMYSRIIDAYNITN